MKRLLIIVPAFNEARMIGKVLYDLPKKIKLISRIDTLVVDDGSTDSSLQVAQKNKAIVLHHILNRGLGATLATGFAYAVKHKYDFVITFDADGQHKSSDIPKIINPLLNNQADVVIGSRLLTSTGMPLPRKIINFFSNIATFLLFNVWTTDSQSGLRGFNKHAIEKIKIRTQRMEVSSEIFKEISRLKLRIKEVPIKSIYTKYSLTKGQSISNAPNVFWKLVLNRFN